MAAEDEVQQLKDEANAEFAQGAWLKSAALYTKAIKLDPSNAVLYRSGPPESALAPHHAWCACAPDSLP